MEDVLVSNVRGLATVEEHNEEDVDASAAVEDIFVVPCWMASLRSIIKSRGEVGVAGAAGGVEEEGVALLGVVAVELGFLLRALVN